MILEHAVEIERPIDEVFEVATCMRRCVVWTTPLYNSQMDSDEPVSVGSTFSFEFRLFGPATHVNGVITEFDPPHSFAFKSTSPFGPFTRLSFTPTEHGTIFRMVFEVKGDAIMGSVEEPSLLKAAIEQKYQQDLEQLKRLMEDDVDLWALTPPLPSVG